MLIKDWVSELLASYSGAFNDKLFKYLGEAGYTGALPDRLMAFWSYKGLTGSFNDRLRKWEPSLQRYFLTFDPVLNSYGELDTAFQPSGDFKVRFKVSTTDAVTTFQCALSGSASGNNEMAIFVRDTGDVRILAYVGTTQQTIIDTTGLNVNDGKLHTGELTYTGTTAELFVDGVSEGTATWALDGNQTIKFIGARAGASFFFPGIISDVEFTDLTTAANSRIFPLAVGAGTTENSTINTGSITINNIPEANRELFTLDDANDRWVGGEELWVSPTLDPSWTDNGDGSYTLVGDGTYEPISISTVEDGLTYLVDFTIDNLSGGNLKLHSAGTIFTMTSTGDYYEALTMTADFLAFSRDGTDVINATLSDVSVKRLLELS